MPKTTKVFSIDPERPNMRLIDAAGRVLRRGGLVAFPTETVYGLGANALDPRAVAKIFAAKGRPADNPLIVHIQHMDELGSLVSHIPRDAKTLMNQFWPGPLTLVFPKSAHVPDIVTAGLSTVAVRMPGNSIASLLIKAAGCPLAAPSANTSTRPSPTSAQHVLSDLQGKIDIIIDGGRAQIGIESTVLDITQKPALILRPGHVTIEEVREWITVADYVPKKGEAPRSPGMKYRHYAPRAEVILVQGSDTAVQIKIHQLIAQYTAKGKKVGVLARGGDFAGDMVLYVETAEKMARYLFSSFRTFDEHNMDVIIAGSVDKQGLGSAIINRMEKASYRIIKV